MVNIVDNLYCSCMQRRLLQEVCVLLHSANHSDTSYWEVLLWEGPVMGCFASSWKVGQKAVRLSYLGSWGDREQRLWSLLMVLWFILDTPLESLLTKHVLMYYSDRVSVFNILCVCVCLCSQYMAIEFIWVCIPNIHIFTIVHSYCPLKCKYLCISLPICMSNFLFLCKIQY